MQMAHTSMSFTTPGTRRSLNQLKGCLQDVSLWINNNKLKLNARKTELLIIVTSTQRAKLDSFFPDTYPESEYHTSHLSFKSRSNV